MNSISLKNFKSMDDLETRIEVMQIPQVLFVFKQAERVIDSINLLQIDLINYWNSDNSVFKTNPSLNRLVCHLALIGLYWKEYDSNSSFSYKFSPDFELASQVCNRTLSLEELVIQCLFKKKKQHLALLNQNEFSEEELKINSSTI